MSDMNNPVQDLNAFDLFEGLDVQDHELVRAQTSNGSQCSSCSGSCGSYDCSYNPYEPGDQEIPDVQLVASEG